MLLRRAVSSPAPSKIATGLPFRVTITGLSLRHNGVVTEVAFSPDGTRLASAAMDQTAKVWDVQTGQELLTIKSPGMCVAFSPDGKRLVSSSSDNTVNLWDAQTGQVLLTLRGHDHVVRCVALSPDGKRLASASGDTVKVWDAQTGRELLTFNGHFVNLAFSPDGYRLASGSNDGTVTIWDATPLPEKP